jgi:hypothetical protein
MKEVRAEDLVSAVAIVDKPMTMTRREKLLHWAALVRKAPGHLYMFSRLEYWSKIQLDEPSYFAGADTAFGLALADPTFSDMGLKGERYFNPDQEAGSVRQVMNFFELSQAQLHEFSCDCGGHISRDQMADCIERLAG